MAEGYLSKPIYLQPPASFLYKNKHEGNGMEIAQHLAPEQYCYEFPRKSYIMSLEQHDEHFDECSSASGDDDMVADNQLSPLQLPQAQVDYRQLGKIHWDEIPFVFPEYNCENVYRSVHPFDTRSSSIVSTIINGDNNSNFSSHSKVVFIKMDKHHTSPPTVCTTDEEYDDFGCPLIESASFFIPFMSEREEQAAIKIQKAWRKYLGRRQLSIEARYKALEERLEKEVKARKAIESTMENMVILMNQQQRVFQERLEYMRETYQRKTDHITAQIHPLEARLRHESKARADIESIMSRVLDQLHNIKLQMKDQIEHRRVIQVKLDKANQKLSNNHNTKSLPKTVIHKK